MANELRRCTQCGTPQHMERRDIAYPESGLDNVQLLNVPVWVCENGHDEVTIPAVNELHELLAHMTLGKPAPLVGPEIKFLRRRLGLTAKEFAARIGLTPVRVSQIENNSMGLPKRADLLFRMWFAVRFSVRDNKPFPPDMVHLHDQLEATLGGVGTHRIRHQENAAREWQEAA